MQKKNCLFAVSFPSASRAESNQAKKKNRVDTPPIKQTKLRENYAENSPIVINSPSLASITH